MTKRFLIFFAAFSLTAIQAGAGTYSSQTLDFNGIPNISGSWAFNKFSLSLGTLTSIEISFTLKATGGYLKLDNDGPNEIDGTFEFGANGTIGSADVKLPIPGQIAAYYSQSFHLDPTPDELLYTGGEEIATASGLVGNAFWSGFIGADTFEMYYSVTLISNIIPSDYIEVFCSRPDTYGAVTVTYNYDTIPEPATFAILGLGMTSIFGRKTQMQITR
jgi:hypothetical protein